jgi:hypothetical protein
VWCGGKESVRYVLMFFSNERGGKSGAFENRQSEEGIHKMNARSSRYGLHGRGGSRWEEVGSLRIGMPVSAHQIRDPQVRRAKESPPSRFFRGRDNALKRDHYSMFP